MPYIRFTKNRCYISLPARELLGFVPGQKHQIIMDYSIDGELGDYAKVLKSGHMMTISIGENGASAFSSLHTSNKEPVVLRFLYEDDKAFHFGP
ncbi:hypothetical protein [Paenibacillus taichungensis]|uniref:hypothetical protein n=1 Tax=Paenibacillus taichungensis TaxID=484184 RepID=UPI0039A60A2C